MDIQTLVMHPGLEGLRLLQGIAARCGRHDVRLVADLRQQPVARPDAVVAGAVGGGTRVARVRTPPAGEAERFVVVGNELVRARFAFRRFV